MKIRTPILFVALGFAFGSACSLILSFNPEGQPCDAAGQCLEGYGCVDGKCHKGADGGIDCALCPAGGCVPGTHTCLPNTCEFKICQAGFECVDANDGAGPQCREIPPGPTTLGFAKCFDDTGCYAMGPSVRHCLIGAVPSRITGTVRGGVCVEECGPEDTCATPGAVCRSFVLGADAGVTKVCLPPNTLTACTSDEGCARAHLVCTVFDHPATGPIEACDLPLASGAKPGQSCVRRGEDGGVLCESGLCIPDPDTASSTTAVCGQTCDTNTCVGEYCAKVEYQVDSPGEPIRYLPMCIPQLSNCADCAGNPTGTCQPDAPHCVPFNGESRCLGACTPDAGALRCPDHYACTELDAGFFCTPESGACP
ncbi:MAG: hypothetical protein IRZ16_12315 [Myxococcaceae bacterium]|nr:hypothetical protein [Myxococcaceae bacterium]